MITGFVGQNALRRLVAASMLLAGTAMAQESTQEPTVASADAIEAKIRAMAPNAEMIAVSEMPIEGLLQVQINSEIYYASADAKYLITGRIIDMDTRIDLTDQAKAGIRRGVLKNIDQGQQISFSPDEPEYELLVFTDIDCGYCRKLHAQMDDYLAAGIAIHYLAFPRAGVGSHSFDKYVSVWCADDQRAALTDAKSGGEPEPLQCENPIEAQYNLGREVGVTGTPALLTSDGTLIPGYVPPEQLKQRLDSLAGQEQTPSAP
jgi:thiol:disulfide interchange protein DsbC